MTKTQGNYLLPLFAVLSACATPYPSSEQDLTKRIEEASTHLKGADQQPTMKIPSTLPSLQLVDERLPQGANPTDSARIPEEYFKMPLEQVVGGYMSLKLFDERLAGRVGIKRFDVLASVNHDYASGRLSDDTAQRRSQSQSGSVFQALPPRNSADLRAGVLALVVLQILGGVSADRNISKEGVSIQTFVAANYRDFLYRGNYRSSGSVSHHHLLIDSSVTIAVGSLTDNMLDFRPWLAFPVLYEAGREGEIEFDKKLTSFKSQRSDLKLDGLKVPNAESWYFYGTPEATNFVLVQVERGRLSKALIYKLTPLPQSTAFNLPGYLSGISASDRSSKIEIPDHVVVLDQRNSQAKLNCVDRKETRKDVPGFPGEVEDRLYSLSSKHCEMLQKDGQKKLLTVGTMIFGKGEALQVNSGQVIPENWDVLMQLASD